MSEEVIRNGHRAALDGLRAFAVLAVMFFHCGMPGFKAGWLGVDLFFVLSGFLITSLLLDEHRKFGAISLRLFWARRFLRLMPAYVLYVSFVTALMLHGGAGLHTHDGWTPAMLIASLWTYTNNFLPVGGIWDWQYLTHHLWSLSVEEQFYFFWPLLLVGLLALRVVGPAVWLAVAVVAALNALAYGGSPPEFMLYTRGIGLFIGCGFAALAPRASSPGWVSAAGAVATLATFLGITTCSVAYGATARDLLRAGVLLFDLGAGVLILGLWSNTASPIARALSLKPLRRLGEISYGVYLYHMLAWALTWNVLLAGIEHWPRAIKFPLRVVVYMSLTLLIAGASFRWFESPFNRLKNRLRSKVSLEPSATHSAEGEGTGLPG